MLAPDGCDDAGYEHLLRATAERGDTDARRSDDHVFGGAERALETASRRVHRAVGYGAQSSAEVPPMRVPNVPALLPSKAGYVSRSGTRATK